MSLQRRAAARSIRLRRNDRQRNRGQHEDDGRDRRGLRKQRCRTARTEGSLGTHSAKRASEIGRLAALQKDHNDQEEAHDYVHNC